MIANPSPVASKPLEKLTDQALLHEFSHLVQQDCHHTAANHAAVLAEAKHKTMKQIDELVARLAPQPDAPSTLRALPTRTTTVTAAPATLAPATPAPTTPAPAPATPAPATPTPRPARAPGPAPLSPGRYKLQVTLGQAAKDKLEQLRDLLAHQIPNGDPAAIIERAIDVLWDQVHKRKTGITAKPRASRPTTRRTRHIKAAARREVWPRDDARCGFIGEGGHRCNATRGLEFAHVFPYAKGGDNTASNLALRCPAHNALQADRDYGAGFMARQRDRRHGKKPLTVREPIARYLVRRVGERPSGEEFLGDGGRPSAEQVSAVPHALTSWRGFSRRTRERCWHTACSPGGTAREPPACAGGTSSDHE